MKKYFYYYFKRKVHTRALNLSIKQAERLKNLTEIRNEMIRYDRFFFNMPYFSKCAYRKAMKLEDNEDTTKLFIRLTAPVYSKPERLKTFAKEFPL